VALVPQVGQQVKGHVCLEYGRIALLDRLGPTLAPVRRKPDADGVAASAERRLAQSRPPHRPLQSLVDLGPRPRARPLKTPATPARPPPRPRLGGPVVKALEAQVQEPQELLVAGRADV